MGGGGGGGGVGGGGISIDRCISVRTVRQFGTSKLFSSYTLWMS